MAWLAGKQKRKLRFLNFFHSHKIKQISTTNFKGHKNNYFYRIRIGNINSLNNKAASSSSSFV